MENKICPRNLTPEEIQLVKFRFRNEDVSSIAADLKIPKIIIYQTLERILNQELAKNGKRVRLVRTHHIHDTLANLTNSINKFLEDHKDSISFFKLQGSPIITDSNHLYQIIAEYEYYV